MISKSKEGHQYEDTSDFFLTGPHVQYRNENMPTSQPELLFHEILHLREPQIEQNV